MQRCSRRFFLAAAVGAAGASRLLRAQSSASRPPNIVCILADDLGYGDLGCYGSSIPTPNLDKMAQEGMRFERFYSASPVCSPSRAALLAGRYPARTGVTNVLMPNASDGLSGSERTIPKVLGQVGYRTACVGKWHLGTKAESQPIRVGFDEFHGVPYSNDMFPLPMIDNTEVVEPSPAQSALSERFTRNATDFIGRHRERPFFLYLALTAPHIPLVPSARFRGKSGQGFYGDVVAELDWSVGEVLAALKQNGLDANTLVVFTSDNGPWYQGSAGRLQGRKGSTYEGGMRVPMIARFPGRIPAGAVSTALASTMDLLPTLASLGGAGTVAGTDGVDIWPVLSGDKPFVDREALLFFNGWELQCVRWGEWKLHLARHNSMPWTADPPGGRWNLPLPQPELYNIDSDPGETCDRAPEYPDIVARLRERAEQVLATLPAQAQNAWRDTLRRRVQGTPVGALPQLEP